MNGLIDAPPSVPWRGDLAGVDGPRGTSYPDPKATTGRTTMTFRYRRSYQGGIQAVLLDWAGTTMDFGCMAPAVVFVEVFKRQGVPITMAEARAPMGAHKRVHIGKITELPAVRKRWEDKRGHAPAEAD